MPKPIYNETRVNEIITAGHQTDPKACSFDDGSAVVVWWDRDSSDAYARQIDGSQDIYTPIGSEYRLDEFFPSPTTTQEDSYFLKGFTYENTNYVAIAFIQGGASPGSDTYVLLRLFKLTGTGLVTVGNIVTVDNEIGFSSIELEGITISTALDSSGNNIGLIAAWRRYTSSSSYAVAQRFDFTTSGSEITGVDKTTYDEFSLFLGNFDMIPTYLSSYPNGFVQVLRKFIDINNASLHGHQFILSSAAEGFEIVGPQLQLSDAFPPYALYHSLAKIRSNDHYLLAFNAGSSNLLTDHEIYICRFRASGTGLQKIGSQFQLTSTTHMSYLPSIAPLVGDDAIVVWQDSFSTDGEIFGHMLSVTDSLINKIGNQFPITQNSGPGTTDPYVIDFSNGRFQVFWSSSDSPICESADIFTRQFFGSLTATNVNQLINYTPQIPYHLRHPITVASPTDTAVVEIKLPDHTAGVFNEPSFGSVSSSYDNGTGIWQASGPAEYINAVLLQLTFTAAAGYSDSLNVTISVGNGINPAINGTIFTYLNRPPYLSANFFPITEGSRLTISSVNLDASDPDPEDQDLDFEFTVTNVNEGQFEISGFGPQMTFTKSQISSSEVDFVDFGAESMPSFDITVSDGSMSSSSTAGNVVYTPVNEGPYVINPLPDYTYGPGDHILIPFDGICTDPDIGDSIRYLAATSGEDPAEVVASGGGQIPAWLSYNPISYELTGTAPSGRIVAMQAVCADTSDLYAVDQFTIRTTGDSLPPSSTDWGDTLLKAGVSGLVTGAIGLSVFYFKRWYTARKRLSGKNITDLQSAVILDPEEKLQRSMAKELYAYLGMQGVEDMDSDAGKRYLRRIKHLIDKLRENEINISHDWSSLEKATLRVQLGETIRQDLRPSTLCGKIGNFFKSYYTCTTDPSLHVSSISYEKVNSYAVTVAAMRKKPMSEKMKKLIRIEYVVKPVAEGLHEKLPQYVNEDYIDFGSSKGEKFLERIYLLLHDLEHVHKVPVETEFEKNRDLFIYRFASALKNSMHGSCLEKLNPCDWCLSEESITTERLKRFSDDVIDHFKYGEDKKEEIKKADPRMFKPLQVVEVEAAKVKEQSREAALSFGH